jgi:hypothetical protein
MKPAVVFFVSLFNCLLSNAQQIFFQSSQTYTEKEIDQFYASVNAGNDLILFNAPDFKLYAYDKHNGKEKWRFNLGRKSDTPPYFAEGFIWVATRDNRVIKLDPNTGKVLATVKASSIVTQPYSKNGVLYFTGIYEGGSLIAYDMKADSVLWTRFLAHGYAVKPIYLDDKIIANVEGDNWIDINYDGSLTAAGCDAAEVSFVSELPCVQEFIIRTHDGRQLKGKQAEAFSLNKYSYPELLTTAQHTFILRKGHLYVLGNKVKKKVALQLSSLSEAIEDDLDNPSKILQADEETVHLLYSNHYIVYNFRNKKVVKILNLEQWEPHQAVVDGGKLWLVSRKDGLLYGYRVE